MNNFDILTSIKDIDKNNAFIDYMIERIQDDNYRGVHSSQHNRWSFKYLDKLISTIYETVGDNEFKIHIGDYKEIKQNGAEKYYQIVDLMNQYEEKGTINSIKKNFFPDLARAGLLERFDKNGNKIEESMTQGEFKLSKKRQSIHFVRLSDKGVLFAKAGEKFTKMKYYTDFIDTLTSNIASNLVELLSTDDMIEYFDILEFMYIFSDDRHNINDSMKKIYLSEYRKLTDVQKDNVTLLLQKYCNPKRNIHGDKTQSRDYHNWKNESQQIFALLENSAYFKILDNKIYLNNGKYGLFVQSPSRSQSPRNKYFSYHQIEKKTNYELHHIIPFSVATTQNDAQFIDNEKNLIYLHNSIHSKFTYSQNTNIQISYNQPIISFLRINSIENIININLNNEEALVSNDKINELIDYNKLLLKKFYNI